MREEKKKRKKWTAAVALMVALLAMPMVPFSAGTMNVE